MDGGKISIVIPTFNGKDLLEKYLPSVLEACKHYSLENTDTEVIVVDDASSDGTADYIRAHFPSVRLLRQPLNLGFSSSANLGIYSAQNRIAVLLNNDVRVAEDFLQFFPAHFKDDKVFAVRPGLKNSVEDGIDNRVNQKIGMKFRFGFIDLPEVTKADTRYASFAGGGAAAFDKEKFTQLGGFDLLFSPFYYEDVDLSYRAWKRGWAIMYEPRSLVYHLGGGTIRKFYTLQYINIVAERNRYFLVWKNIRDGKILLQHLFFIPLRQIVNLLRLDAASFAGFFMALKYLVEILKKRRAEKQNTGISDREVFNFFKGR